MWLSFKHPLLIPVLKDQRADTVCISAFFSVSSVFTLSKNSSKSWGFFLIFQFYITDTLHVSSISVLVIIKLLFFLSVLFL